MSKLAVNVGEGGLRSWELQLESVRLRAASWWCGSLLFTPLDDGDRDSLLGRVGMLAGCMGDYGAISVAVAGKVW